MGAAPSIPAGSSLSKETLEALEKLPDAAKAELLELSKKAMAATSGSTQSAFVFVKPHANTAKMQEMVKEKFAEKGINILKEGEVSPPCLGAAPVSSCHALPAPRVRSLSARATDGRADHRRRQAH